MAFGRFTHFLEYKWFYRAFVRSYFDDLNFHTQFIKKSGKEWCHAAYAMDIDSTDRISIILSAVLAMR